MIIPKENRLTIYRFLFQEGVMVAKKDFKLETHPNIPSVSNLEVLMIMKSLKSKKLITESFNWQYYYWVLTDAGIKYLSQYLQLPESVVPATLKKPTLRPASSRYSGSGDGEKRTYPSGEFNPSFHRGSGERRGPRPGQRDGRPGYRRDAPQTQAPSN
eukprot:gene11111-13595_t